jgi:hypothetical protein
MNTNKHENLVSTIQIDSRIRDKFEEWKNILIGEDIHSIRNQIARMIWDSAFFQCLNESRKYVAKNGQGEDKINAMLHYFINQSFFKTQLLSIRRLVDKDFGRVNNGKEYTVYSLYNIIKDIKKNSDLLTRENVFIVYDLPYDYEIDCTKPYYVPHKISSSETLHYQIDSILGITPDKRNPKDLIPIDILNEYEDKHNIFEELYQYVNKYIVHSATPESRKDVPDEIEGALGKVLNAQEIICKTASCIGNKLLFCGFGDVLHISQYGRFDEHDVFEYLDEPIATKETIKTMRKYWERYRRETNQWNQL